MTCWEPGTEVMVLHGGAWEPAVVVDAGDPTSLGWWPGVDFTRAVALRLHHGGATTPASVFDVVVIDPTSDLLRPAVGPRPRPLKAVGP